MKFYVVLSGIYRLLCGMILLTLNWSFATSSGDQYLSLAIATCISFIPALFVPFLIKPLITKFGGKNITTVSLGAMAIIIIPLIWFNNYNTFKLIIFFLLWFVFFVMESSWEIWFVDLSRNKSNNEINRYSSISISSNQCALLIGPLFVPFLLSIFSYSVFYTLMAVATIIIMIVSSNQKSVHLAVKEEKINNTIKVKSGTMFLSALVLIWPILGAFNFMLPIHVLNQGSGQMIHVGVLDAAMSSGMALVGFVALIKLNSKLHLIKIILLGIGIIISLISWALFTTNIIGNIIGLFILGFSFGGLRIELRSQLAQKLSSSEVGNLVLIANALALPILILSIFIIKIHLELIWLPPFILSFILFVLLFNINRNNNALIKNID